MENTKRSTKLQTTGALISSLADVLLNADAKATAARDAVEYGDVLLAVGTLTDIEQDLEAALGIYRAAIHTFRSAR